MEKERSKAGAFLKSERMSSTVLTAAIIVLIIAINIAMYALSGMFGLLYTSAEEDKVVLTGNTDQLFEEAIAQKKKVKMELYIFLRLLACQKLCHKIYFQQ